MKWIFVSLTVMCASSQSLFSQVNPVTTLPGITVYSARVANQESSGNVATPITALRYEPAVDLEARNSAEGQADIIIRGGIFENTGMRVGAVSLLDPQTGHYS